MTIVEDAAELETPEELEDFHAFRACIHRGSQQIGGTCIELASGDARILLDLGLPLDASDTDPDDHIVRSKKVVFCPGLRRNSCAGRLLARRISPTIGSQKSASAIRFLNADLSSLRPRIRS